jgi:hypothetical protein
MIAKFFLLLALVVCALAHKKYLPLIPNADNAPVKAIGHIDPAGGGAANDFGKAFKDAGLVWTVDLCCADTDGDGQSNGLELGDPCCVWAKGDNPAFRTDISLPANSSSITGRAMPTCPSNPCA